MGIKRLIGTGVGLATFVGLSTFAPGAALQQTRPSDEYLHVDYARKKLICEPRQNASTTSLIEQWQMPAGGMTYKVNTSSIPLLLNDEQVLNAIANAASTWTNAGASPITYGGTTSGANDINDGVNSISFGVSRPDTVGTATMRIANGVVQEADIVLDAATLWATNPASSTGCSGALGKFDVQNVMTHEFGHWVGAQHPLAGGDGNKWRTMYSEIAPGELYKRSLTAGDLASIPSATPSSFYGTVSRAGDDDG